MIDLEDKSSEKWKVQMCWWQIQQRSASQTSSLAAAALRDTTTRLWWQEESRAVEEMMKTLKRSLAHSAAHFGSEIKAKWHWSFSHLFLRTPGLENFTTESSWEGSRERYQQQRDIIIGKLDGGGSTQVVQSSWPLWTHSSPQSLTVWNVKQPTNPTVWLLTALVCRWSLNEQPCGCRVALHQRIVVSHCCWQHLHHYLYTQISIYLNWNRPFHYLVACKTFSASPNILRNFFFNYANTIIPHILTIHAILCPIGRSVFSVEFCVFSPWTPIKAGLTLNWTGLYLSCDWISTLARARKSRQNTDTGNWAKLGDLATDSCRSFF